MKPLTKKVLYLGLILMLCVSCNLPLASLFGGSGDEGTSDSETFIDEDTSGGGLFSGGSGSKSGQKGGKEKPLSGNLTVVSQAFWPYYGENEVILAAIVKNTDTQLTVFHPSFKFQLLDADGQTIALEEGLTMRLEDGTNQFPELVLYPGQEFLYCEVARLEGRTSSDLSSMVITPASEPMGVDLGITSNPIVATRTTLTNLGDVYNGQLQSGVILSNSRDRIAFMPWVTTAGFDAGGNIINCGREYGTPHFIRENSQAASTFRLLNNSVPASYQSYAAQDAAAYYLQDETWEIKESNQLTVSQVNFIQDDLDLLPVYYLTNNNQNNGDFDYSVNYFAYDAAGDVAGAVSSRLSSLFAPGTSYGPFHYLQGFVIPGKQIARLEVDVVTYDVTKKEFEVPVAPVQYNSISFDAATGNINTQASSQVGDTVFFTATAACYDSGGSLIGYGWNSEYLEANTTIPFSLYTFDLGGNTCSGAAKIEVNSEIVD